jgi:putative flavoprotein involved in K+ transport
MNEKIFDVIVTGAGYAGLCAGYHLKKFGLTHLIFERGRVGESWRSQRWDSFRMNSANKLNVLPCVNCDADKADAFASAPEFVSSLERFVATHQLPVKENAKVISVEKQDDIFHVTVSTYGLMEKYYCRQILIASGVVNEIKIPSFAAKIFNNLKQIHTGEYRNADQLPPGAVLVVGGAQSGIQIAEDLLHAGRKVFLSTSLVGRIPRWYRGRDIFDWVIATKFYDIKAEEIADPKMLDLRPPHVSGTGNGKESLSLQSLAKKGAVILGKMFDADDHHAFFHPNAVEHVKFADEFSDKIKKLIDEYILNNNLQAPPPHDDEADIPDKDASCASSITSLDFRKNNISTVIWASGFHVDYSYIKLPVFDETGKLKHRNGIPDFPGLYFLGYPWLRSRKSPILFGIIEDAEFVAQNILEYSRIIPSAT